MKLLHPAIAFLLFATRLFGCSAFEFSADGYPLVAKNMDWPRGLGLIFVNKRHQKKRAASMMKNPLHWKSKYMSLTLSATGRDFPWDGMNEAGLSVMALALAGTAIPPHTDPRPSINYVQWMQYILDTSASVDESVENSRRVRVGDPSTVHYFICDSMSECAVLEYLKEELVIHKGSALRYSALTNNGYAHSEAYFEKQLKTASPIELLNRVSHNSLDRFSRAAIWSKSFSGETEPLEYAQKALSNLAQTDVPWPTQWQMIFGLRQKRVWLKSRTAPEMKSVRLDAFDPSCRTGVELLDLNLAAGGEVTNRFIPYTKEINRDLALPNPDLKPEIRELIANYPETYTSCEE